jgi:hypothetical protein
MACNRSDGLLPIGPRYVVFTKLESLAHGGVMMLVVNLHGDPPFQHCVCARDLCLVARVVLCARLCSVAVLSAMMFMLLMADFPLIN